VGKYQSSKNKRPYFKEIQDHTTYNGQKKKDKNNKQRLTK
jgi:hypothetical protein